MAIERVNSVFDVPALKAEFDVFKTGMEESQATLVNLYNTIKSYKGSTIKTIADDTTKLDKATRDAINTQNKLNQSMTVAERLRMQALRTQREEIKNETELEKKLQQTNRTKETASKLEVTLARNKTALTKAQEAEKAALDKIDNAYEQLKKQYTEASNLSKRRGAEILAMANGNEKLYKSMLGQDEVYQAATDAAQRYYKQLDLLETETGQYQRRVGQYERANAGLSMSINQLTRELPAFAMNLNTGFMAISNNLPMLFDELQKIKRANVELADSGQKPKSVLGELGKAFFSWQTALSVGVTLITVYGGKLIEMVAGLFDAESALRKAEDAAGKFNEAQLEILRTQQRVIDTLSGDLDTPLERQLKMMQAQGKSRLEILAVERKLRQERLAAADEEFRRTGGFAQLDQLADRLRSAQMEYERVVRNEENLDDDELERRSKLAKQKLDLESELYNQQKKIVTDRINLYTDVQVTEAEIESERTKVMKEEEEKRKKLSDDEYRAQVEILKLRIKAEQDAWDRILENDDAGAAERLLALQKSYEKRAEIIELEMKLEERFATNAKERQLAKVRAEVALNELYVESGNKRLQILQTQLAKEKDLVDEYTQYFADLPEKMRAKIKDEEENRFASAFFLNDAEYTKKLQILNDRLKTEQLTYEQYQQEKEQIDIEFARRELSRQQTMLQSRISVLKALGYDTKKEQEALNEVMRKLYEQDAKDKDSAEKKKQKSAKETFDDLKESAEKFNQINNNLSRAIVEIASIGIDKQKVAVEELEAAQQKRYENEVARITQSTLTEEEKANRLKILEAERQAQRDANDRRQRQLEVQRARFQRSADIANIISSTAVAVINALGAKPWSPLNIALAASVGAIGAAQLARAVAVPLPRFEHGTESAPGGWAITDEKGPEMYMEPGGKTYMGSDGGPTLRYLKPGTKVIPANEVNDSIYRAMLANTARQLGYLQMHDNNDSTLQDIKEAIEAQTAATLREMRRTKKPTNINNIIDLGWAQYRRKKTFN